jgi:hypothetical protein
VVAGIALYKESDDLPDSSPYPWLSLFPVIETDGTLVFRWATEASIQGLVRAYESGLLPGDPRRPYLWPMIPQGGEVWFGSWPDLLEALKVFKDVAETMAAAYGSVQAVQALWGRLRGIDELDADQFEQHNAGPSQLDSILKPGRLSVPDLPILDSAMPKRQP